MASLLTTNGLFVTTLNARCWTLNFQSTSYVLHVVFFTFKSLTPYMTVHGNWILRKLHFFILLFSILNGNCVHEERNRATIRGMKFQITINSLANESILLPSLPLNRCYGRQANYVRMTFRIPQKYSITLKSNEKNKPTSKMISYHINALTVWQVIWL